ncbi:MAG: hypothetical protein ACTSUE_01950 [Promethearchaeota archaeon]
MSKKTIWDDFTKYQSSIISIIKVVDNLKTEISKGYKLGFKCSRRKNISPDGSSEQNWEYQFREILDKDYRSLETVTEDEDKEFIKKNRQNLEKISRLLQTLFNIMDTNTLTFTDEFLKIFNEISDKIFPKGKNKREIIDKILKNERFFEVQRLLFEINRFDKERIINPSTIPTIEPVFIEVLVNFTRRLNLNELICKSGNDENSYWLPAVNKSDVFEFIPDYLLQKESKMIIIDKLKKLDIEECEENRNILTIKRSLVRKLKPYNLFEEIEIDGNKTYISRLDTNTFFQLYLADMCFRRTFLTPALTNQIATIFSIILIQYYFTKFYKKEGKMLGQNPFYRLLMDYSLQSRMIMRLARVIANEKFLNLQKEQVQSTKVHGRQVFEYITSKQHEIYSFIQEFL